MRNMREELREARQAEAEDGRRAAAALEYVGNLIDAEVKRIFISLASPEQSNVDVLVSYLRAFMWVKNVLVYRKKTGDEAEKILSEE